MASYAVAHLVQAQIPHHVIDVHFEPSSLELKKASYEVASEGLSV